MRGVRYVDRQVLRPGKNRGSITATDLAPQQELAVYRVLQEALQNVHKHANATTVGVVWQRSNTAWTLHVTDGPRFKGTDIPSDFHYFNWVDQHNVAGLGANTPFATGSNSEAILALDPKTGKWLKLRVPYPLGFYHRGMDGRIDDPAAGWKGRGLWSASGDRTPWLNELGKGARPMAVHIQVRPDPLAH